jgi:hypothetical protein
VAWLQTGARNLGQHRREEKRIRVAHKRDGYGRVFAKLFFQTGGRSHAGKASPENDNPFPGARIRRHNVCLWTKSRSCKITKALGQATQRASIQNPTDQSREVIAHLFGAPLGHLTREQRKGDNVEQTPKGYTERGRRHEAVDIGVARRAQT